MARQEATPLDEDFFALVREPAFPCAGAKSALSQGRIGSIVGGDLRCPSHDAQMVAAVQQFAATVPEDELFVSVVLEFPETPMLPEAEFEAALWSRLRAFHEIDRRDHSWDPSVSNDPMSPRFSMSLGGRAFYVIGLHPGASRPARRFRHAALVLNLHSQFETLREAGRYDKLRETIIDRDIAFSGSRNPMLAVHGESSEARQYSGRQVDDAWRCPFASRA